MTTEKESPSQIEVEEPATRLGEVSAGVAASVTLPAHRVIDATSRLTHGLKPFGQRLLKQGGQSAYSRTETVVTVDRERQGARQQVLGEARAVQAAQQSCLSHAEVTQGVQQPENHPRIGMILPKSLVQHRVIEQPFIAGNASGP